MKGKENMNYLSHHGIKGQQWGVRNGPPYPLNTVKGDVTIRKGTKLQRVSHYNESNDPKKNGHMYFTYDKRDAKRYEKTFGTYIKLRDKSMDDVMKNEYVTTVDLKAPSLQTRYDTFNELYDSDEQFRKKLGAYYKSDNKKFTPMNQNYYESKFNNYKGDRYKVYSKVFVRSLGSEDSYTRDAYFKKLANKGYNFVTDEQDQRNGMGYNPSIMFDKEGKVKHINATTAETSTLPEYVLDATIKKNDRNKHKYDNFEKSNERRRR